MGLGHAVTISTTSSDRVPCSIRVKFPDQIDVHRILLETAISIWRAYVVDIGFEAEGHSGGLLGVSLDG
jgi:hypothetical protein